MDEEETCSTIGKRWNKPEEKKRGNATLMRQFLKKIIWMKGCV